MTAFFNSIICAILGKHIRVNRQVINKKLIVYIKSILKSDFTLTEVLVAMAILGISLVMLLNILGGARERIIKAEERWGEEHLITRATEFYLIEGVEAEPPTDLFPEGFSTECVMEPVPLDTTVQMPEPLELVSFNISLYDKAGAKVAERELEKVIYRNVNR